MGQMNVEQFKLACAKYLTANVDIGGLRAYGRRVGVPEPTKLNKQPLVEKIVAILCGELAPEERSKRGAPLKNDYVDPAIVQAVDDLRAQYLHYAEEPSFAERYAQFLKENKSGLKLVFKENDDAKDVDWKETLPLIYRGQLQMFDGLAVLLPLDCKDSNEKILVATQLIHEYDLREGDVISCEVQKGAQALVATKIHTVNEIAVNELKRNHFETAEVMYPKQTMALYTPQTSNIVLGKYIDWLVPMFKGQRCLIRSVPKAGKTALMFQLADAMQKANVADKLFVLLNGQLPEVISQYRKKIPSENLLYSSYEDEPEKQVFVAEYLLKRAKRYAETGKHVVILIDSINALANAFNETKESMGGKVLAGGLESKTLQFIKKFFGAARTFEKGGSLTICTTVCMQSGNPADDVLCNELSTIANYQLTLHEHLAMQRIYPAIQLAECYTCVNGLLGNDISNRLYSAVVNGYLPKMGEGSLLRLLDETDTKERFEQLVQAWIKK